MRRTGTSNRLYRELHALTGQRARANPRSELAHILLLDQATVHLEVDLRWLDMVEGRPMPEPEAWPRGHPRPEG